MSEDLKRLQLHAEHYSYFAAALYRTGHENKARDWEAKAEAAWQAWIAAVEAQQRPQAMAAGFSKREGWKKWTPRLC